MTDNDDNGRVLAVLKADNDRLRRDVDRLMLTSAELVAYIATSEERWAAHRAAHAKESSLIVLVASILGGIISSVIGAFTR